MGHLRILCDCPETSLTATGTVAGSRINLNWNDVQRYVTWLSEVTGHPIGYRGRVVWGESRNPDYFSMG